MGRSFQPYLPPYVCVPVDCPAWLRAFPGGRRAGRTPAAVRAGVVLVLPVVTEDWQVYALIFLLQVASLGGTPAVQATIPDVLPGEKVDTNTLSLLRLTARSCWRVPGDGRRCGADAPMPGLLGLMILWAAISFGFAVTQVPVGCILNRSA